MMRQYPIGSASPMAIYRNFLKNYYNLLYTPIGRQCRYISNKPDLSELGPPPRKPKRFFDLKRFRDYINKAKTAKIESEKLFIARANALPPPEGWTILDFLNKIEIGDNAEDIANSFKTWNEFITAAPEELYVIDVMTNSQKRKLLKYITLYNHGLWPDTGYDSIIKKFQAKPLENEDKPWTTEDDNKLMQLCEYYDVKFGDPWIYISWEMQREIDDVRDRYHKIHLLPMLKSRKCEICITKASKPLYMSRYFKLLPQTLYIIPSKDNYNIAPVEDITKLIPENLYKLIDYKNRQ